MKLINVKDARTLPKFFQDANKLKQGFSSGLGHVMFSELDMVHPRKDFYTCQFCKFTQFEPDDLWGIYYWCLVGGFMVAKQTFCNEYKDGVFVMTFIDACLQGKAKLSQVNDWIDKWHNEKLEISLHSFLGLSKVEYEKFVMDNDYLQKVISAKKVDSSV